MKKIFTKTENSETNESHKFVLNLSWILDLKSSNNYVGLQKLSIYYTCKRTRQQYKNSKLKSVTPSWNEEFVQPDGSYSVSDYIEHITKNMKHCPLILLSIFTLIGLLTDYCSKLKMDLS